MPWLGPPGGKAVAELPGAFTVSHFCLLSPEQRREVPSIPLALTSFDRWKT
jgi:hypothetical protein